MTAFVPVTPGDTPLIGLAADTEEKAINRLMVDASHMPYGTWKNFKKRGYTIERWEKTPPVSLKNVDWAGAGSRLSLADMKAILTGAGRNSEVL